jgi:hypothetical protein
VFRCLSSGTLLGLFVALLVSTILSACGEDQARKQPPSQNPEALPAARSYDIGGAALIDSMQADLTGDGIPEVILFSLADSLAEEPLLQGNFDRVDIFDTTRKPIEKLFFDLLEDGRRAFSEDVTGDGVTDLIVEVDGGGNNPVISRGVHLYGLNDRGQVTLLFFTTSGSPELRDLDGDGVREILLSDQFWGMMAHADAIVYTREIYSFDGNSYLYSNDRYAGYFDRMLTARSRSYEQEKRVSHNSDEARLRLYRKTADVLAWSYARGGAARVSRLWRGEETYLKSELYEEQYEDLSAFVDEVSSQEYEKQQTKVS